MELRYYYEVLRRRSWVIALLLIVAVGGVIVQTTGQPPQYEAEVSMLVTPRIIAPTAFDNPELSGFQGDYRRTVLRNMALIVESSTVRERVTQRVGGMSVPELKRRLKVTQIPGSDFIIISATHDEAARASLLANATAEEFVNYYVQISRAEATGAREFIDYHLKVAQDRLRAAEQGLLNFKARVGAAVELSEGVSRTVQRTLDMQAAYEAAVLNEKIARTRVASIQARLRAQGDLRLASVSIGTNPVVAQVRNHLMGLELELAGLRQLYTDQHPRVQAVQGRIAETQQRLNAEAAKVLTDQSMGVSPIREHFVREMISGEVDVAVVQARAAGTLPILNRMQARLKDLPQNEMALARLEREVRTADSLSSRLSSLHQEALIRESKAGSAGRAAIVIVDPAKVPQWPVSSGLPVKAGFAGLLGLVLGASLVLLTESMDTRIRTPKEAEGAFGVPVLASIPTMNSGSYRQLTAATSGVAKLVVPLLLVLLVLAVIGGLYISQVKAMPDSITQVGQALMQTFHSVR